MPKVDKAVISATRVMRGRAIVVSMLGTKTPAASLPKGAIFDNMTRSVMVALETIGELDLSSSTPLSKYDAIFQTVFSFFNIRWTLGGENMWDPIIMGGKKESGGGRGTRGKKVLLETSTDCTGSKASFHYK